MPKKVLSREEILEKKKLAERARKSKIKKGIPGYIDEQVSKFQESYDRLLQIAHGFFHYQILSVRSQINICTEMFTLLEISGTFKRNRRHYTKKTLTKS